MLKQNTFNFLKNPVFGELLLIFCCTLAIFMTNSNFLNLYKDIINYPIFKFYSHYENFTILDLVNNILMTLFFLEIGIEIKHEILFGALNNKSKAILPGIAALGGMIIPALVYSLTTMKENNIIQSGWAISIATDIVFAVGILRMLGNKIPHSLIVFLLALAIFDDIGAILAIALFYSSKINQSMILCSFGIILILFLLNFYKIKYLTIYCILGVSLWVFIFFSGIHATLSGIILGVILPHQSSINKNYFNAIFYFKKLLSKLTKYCILPCFAFVNSGIHVNNISYDMMFSSLTIGIFLGLVFGKPVGVFIFSYLSILCKFSKLPTGISLKEIFGVSLLCGIGFTMSIFISNLAFSDIYIKNLELAKFSVLLSSLISGVSGFLFLYKIYKNKKVNKRII
ncbi:sodium-proton antiporter [Wigglesworthia glossinidia endosymbiont of Glossina morsitans morsitans (Yale colony)]|uniref:Na(+)/H(+) antiporter NhaA n=1 Tax=Wigglesworthia glossinidia endosymbiont of Glossina morsitans morsitans (Yale colony) TaxID=1142511 RepID=H6Q520_WIGGL|nr:Na+/H+ antiporter NhaA [Wigglesworthia glossinidia]AFA41303.1 sodium-proton antiporter [Wigglesworthia glossinidia endosymbiont of Glossina morsitans morsitans (Yale colony)]